MLMKINFNTDTMRDRVYACWLGKNIGGTMGTPFEGKQDILDIKGFTSEPGKPLPNDDLDLQLVWLKALSEVGPQALDAKVLGEYWLSYIGPPWNEYGVCKANMRLGIVPPMSGELFNEEWKHSNGAWIRTEVWACTYPALPEKAIRFAFEDACVDHGFGEGTFAAIFVAAMQSAAFAVDDLDKLIEIGLSKIPEDSRVARSVKLVLDCYDKGMNWQDTRNKVVEDSSDLGWFQAPANVAFVILGLKYGECDFKKSMILAINCGDDTDCTGATLGALLGIMYGTKAIPQDWKAYIGDDIITISIITGNARFPKSCSELTDDIMDMLPVTTYAGFGRPSELSAASGKLARVTVSEQPDLIEDFNPDSFLGRGFVDSIKCRAQYSFTEENEYVTALIEFDKAPIIAAGGAINVKITLTNRRCIDYKSFLCEWILPEGFAATGNAVSRVNWRGKDKENHDQSLFTITAPEQMMPVNNLILRISSPGRSKPLLVPIVLLS